MKVKEYLVEKYGNGGSVGLSDAEARAIGIPLPLRSGWVTEYANVTITGEQARVMVESLALVRERTKGERRREIVQRGIDALCAVFGPMLDIEERVALECTAVAVDQKRASRSELRREKRREKKKAKLAQKKAPKSITRRQVSYPSNVNTDAFLQSYEWRRVRMVVLKRDGATCACCGATPGTGAVMNVDHIKPRRIFPQLALDPSNLQVLCNECNHGKGNWDMTDWRAKETT